MERKIRLILIMVVCFNYTLVFSQDEPFIDNSGVESIDLNILEQNLSPVMFLIEDVNKLDSISLVSLNIFNPNEIKKVIDFIEENRPLLSPYELQHVTGVDFYKLTQLIILFNGRMMPTEGKTTSGYLMTRFQRNGYYGQKTIYPWKQLNRFELNVSENLEMGFVMEKDDGERLFFQPNEGFYGYDFYSFYLRLKSKNEAIIVNLGDYRLQSGQGLVFSSGLSLGKGGEAVSGIYKWQNKVNEYSSTLESGFFRGGAFTYQFPLNISLISFYSWNKEDAVINFANNTPSFRSIQSSGYHRTTHELFSRNSLSVSEGGGVLFYQGKNFQVGVNLLLSRFSAERKPSDDVYNFHQISGSDFINHSIYGNFKWRGKLFFGELARSNSGRMALIYGGLFPFSKKADFMFLYRNYEPGYFSLHGKAFGENSVNQNEKGLYVGFKYKLSKWVSFSTNSDIFYFPWVSYQSSKPYSGFETRLTGEFKFKSNSLIKLRYRVERKMSDDVLIQKNTINTTYWNKHQFMFHFSYKIHSNLEYRLRIQTNRIITGNNRSSGYLTYNELIYNKSKIQLAFRYCNFQIDNYENREYVYEKDLEYAFSLPAFQDTGYRFYTYLKLKASKHITGWLKYGIRRNNAPLENFYQNRLIFFQDLKIQFRYKL